LLFPVALVVHDVEHKDLSPNELPGREIVGSRTGMPLTWKEPRGCESMIPMGSMGTLCRKLRTTSEDELPDQVQDQYLPEE